MIPPPPPPKSEHDRVTAPHPASDMIAPPPPPPPIPPVVWVYLHEISEKGAVFFLDGKQITGKEAVQIAKKNKEINVLVRDHNSKKPIVKLSKDPIVLD